MIFAVDPGPETCGFALYDGERRRVDASMSAMPVANCLSAVASWADAIDTVVIERVQSYGISGSSLLRTAEVVGRVWQAAVTAELPVELYYRREVLQTLDITGKGNRDALVRQRIIEMFGGDRRLAVGLKASPGPCYGVSGHAWQALGVALTYVLRRAH